MNTNKLKNLSAFAFFLLFNLSLSTIIAQNDTMYVMKNGAIVGKYNVNKQIDSIIFYQPVIVDSTKGSFTDSRDGNKYNWVKIGNQIWMAENLKWLPEVVSPATGSMTIPYYYVYGYSGSSVTDAKNTANYTTFGVLYNWSAAMAGSASSTSNPSGVQGVCPTDWHLPSDAEWTELTNYLGGASVAGGKLKETGTTHWYSPNAGATNETGFTALSNGYRDMFGKFDYIRIYGRWWSATGAGTNSAWLISMYYNDTKVFRFDYSKDLGNPIRCIRD